MTKPDGANLIYIDRHLVHEVTSPQALEGLRLSGRRVRRRKTLAVVDQGRSDNRSLEWHRRSRKPHSGRTARRERLGGRASNISTSAIVAKASFTSSAPNKASTLPGATIVCGDSHASTHGAFGALAHGIGTSEVEHVFATQTLIQAKAKNMRVTVDGALGDGVSAKDLALGIIGEIGTAGGTGHVIEYAGEAIRALSMEGRMTVCNMTIEAGARAGMIAPDAKTFALSRRPAQAPKGAAWDAA